MHEDGRMDVHKITSFSDSPTTMSRGWIAALWRHEEAMRRAVILALLYLIPAVLVLQPVVNDNDIWWHLQTGKWIVEHGTIPTTDPFSAYGEGKPWVAYSWLFEVGIFGLVHLFGESGIILYTLVLTWLIILVLHRIIGTRCHNFVVVCGLLATSVVCMSALLVPRTWLVTILFFAITLEVVLSLREGKTSLWFWFLPLFYVLWANTHIQFIYGLGLLGLACVASLLDQFSEPYTGFRPVIVLGSPRWNKLVGLTSLCALATLVTPYHVHIYSVVAELSAQTGMWDYLQEMQAPPFRSLGNWVMLGLFSLTLVQLGRRSSWSSFEVLLVVFAAASAFRGQRDIWFLVLACLAVILSQYPQSNMRQWSILRADVLVPAILFVSLGVVCILGFRGFSEDKIHENTRKLYPLEAATFVEEQGYNGPLYNHLNWGGYLIWRLPQLKVSMDGRANIYGDERIEQALLTWNGNFYWEENSDLNKAGVVIARREFALASLLRLDSRFRLVYEDETAMVFIRAPQDRGQSNAPALEGSFSDPLIADLSPAR